MSSRLNYRRAKWIIHQLQEAWEGGTLFSNAWAISKGAPNLENAMKFIGFSTMAIPQARYSMLL